jgi:hypothetical protein
VAVERTPPQATFGNVIAVLMAAEVMTVTAY